MSRTISQFDIYWVDLDPTQGVETQKTRPCVILSSDVINQGKLLLIAPLLKSHKPWPYVINLTPSKANQLDQERRIDLRQMKAIDKTVRLGKFKGHLENSYWPEIKTKIKLFFSLDT